MRTSALRFEQPFCGVETITAQGLHFSHLGRDAQIQALTSTTTGSLGINDIDFTGALTSAHNATGHAAWNVPNYYLQPCSPQVATPGASSGYTATLGDGITEPAPGLLYDGATYIDTNSSKVISPVTLSATTTSGGIFTSGAARRADANFSCYGDRCFEDSGCLYAVCWHPDPGTGGDPGAFSHGGGGFNSNGGGGCVQNDTCHHGGGGGNVGGGNTGGGGLGGGGGSRGGGSTSILGPDWTLGDIAALNALGYTASFGSAALQIGMVFVPGGEFGDAAEFGAEIAAGAPTPFAVGEFSILDLSGGLKGINTNVTATDFIANLESNGFVGSLHEGPNGPVTVLTNGEGLRYSVYTRTSTGVSGAQYFGSTKQIVKINLGGP